MLIDGINVEARGLEEITEGELKSYVDYVKEHTAGRIERIAITAAPGGCVTINYALAPQKFERIRRITGYLVGTIDRWNDAKQAEEHDRVKHGMH